MDCGGMSGEGGCPLARVRDGKGQGAEIMSL